MYSSNILRLYEYDQGEEEEEQERGRQDEVLNHRLERLGSGLGRMDKGERVRTKCENQKQP